MLVYGPSHLDTALHDQTTSVGLGHRVIHASRMAGAEACEHRLRRRPIVWLAHHAGLPLTGSEELHRSTTKSVAKEREWCDDEPDDAGRNAVLDILGRETQIVFNTTDTQHYGRPQRLKLYENRRKIDYPSRIGQHGNGGEALL